MIGIAYILGMENFSSVKLEDNQKETLALNAFNNSVKKSIEFCKELLENKKKEITNDENNQNFYNDLKKFFEFIPKTLRENLLKNYLYRSLFDKIAECLAKKNPLNNNSFISLQDAFKKYENLIINQNDSKMNLRDYTLAHNELNKKCEEFYNMYRQINSILSQYNCDKLINNNFLQDILGLIKKIQNLLIITKKFVIEINLGANETEKKTEYIKIQRDLLQIKENLYTTYNEQSEVIDDVKKFCSKVIKIYQVKKILEKNSFNSVDSKRYEELYKNASQILKDLFKKMKNQFIIETCEQENNMPYNIHNICIKNKKTKEPFIYQELLKKCNWLFNHNGDKFPFGIKIHKGDFKKKFKYIQESNTDNIFIVSKFKMVNFVFSTKKKNSENAIMHCFLQDNNLFDKITNKLKNSFFNNSSNDYIKFEGKDNGNECMIELIGDTIEIKKKLITEITTDSFKIIRKTEKEVENNKKKIIEEVFEIPYGDNELNQFIELLKSTKIMNTLFYIYGKPQKIFQTIAFSSLLANYFYTKENNDILDNKKKLAHKEQEELTKTLHDWLHQEGGYNSTTIIATTEGANKNTYNLLYMPTTDDVKKNFIPMKYSARRVEMMRVMTEMYRNLSNTIQFNNFDEQTIVFNNLLGPFILQHINKKMENHKISKEKLQSELFELINHKEYQLSNALQYQVYENLKPFLDLEFKHHIKKNGQETFIQIKKSWADLKENHASKENILLKFIDFCGTQKSVISLMKIIKAFEDAFKQTATSEIKFTKLEDHIHLLISHFIISMENSEKGNQFTDYKEYKGKGCIYSILYLYSHLVFHGYMEMPEFYLTTNKGLIHFSNKYSGIQLLNTIPTQNNKMVIMRISTKISKENWEDLNLLLMIQNKDFLNKIMKKLYEINPKNKKYKRLNELHKISKKKVKDISISKDLLNASKNLLNIFNNNSKDNKLLLHNLFSEHSYLVEETNSTTKQEDIETLNEKKINRVIMKIKELQKAGLLLKENSNFSNLHQTFKNLRILDNKELAKLTIDKFMYKNMTEVHINYSLWNTPKKHFFTKTTDWFDNIMKSIYNCKFSNLKVGQIQFHRSQVDGIHLIQSLHNVLISKKFGINLSIARNILIDKIIYLFFKKLIIFYINKENEAKNTIKLEEFKNIIKTESFKNLMNTLEFKRIIKKVIQGFTDKTQSIKESEPTDFTKTQKKQYKKFQEIFSNFQETNYNELITTLGKEYIQKSLPFFVKDSLNNFSNSIENFFNSESYEQAGQLLSQILKENKQKLAIRSTVIPLGLKLFESSFLPIIIFNFLQEIKK